jgi:adenine/guanine phosphoribosyltransferase-like PRPP-binding protein
MTDHKTIVRESFDNKPCIPMGDYRFLINPLTEQIPATSAELLSAAADWLVEAGNYTGATKIAGEEDKGAILVAAVALKTGLPFGMARWYPSGIDGQVSVDFNMEYTKGQLFLNGIEPGDKVVIVDDMVSTGGTMVALIQAIQQAGAEILDIVCVGEKPAYNGVERIFKETGFRVKTLVKIDVAGEKSHVFE